jgi:hypothetical protein
LTTPEQIQRDIEGTRRSLSSDVDRLTEKVSPGRVVSRRVDRLKSGAVSVRERVMGAMPDPHQVKSSAGDAAGSGLSSAKDTVGTAASTVGDAASTVGDAVTGAPQAVKQRTQGNPLGAGLVAFGVGVVLSSMVPATEHEKELAAQAQDTAMGPLQDKAKEIGAELQGSVQESAQHVTETARDAASHTAGEARSAVEDVKAPLQQ